MTLVNSFNISLFSFFDAQGYRSRIASVYSRMLPRTILLLLGKIFGSNNYRSIRGVDKHGIILYNASAPTIVGTDKWPG